MRATGVVSWTRTTTTREGAMTDTHDGPESFQVQVSGSWGAFTAYVPHLDLEVEAATFEEAERRAVEAARATHRKGPHHD